MLIASQLLACKHGSEETASVRAELRPISVSSAPAKVLDVPRTLRLTGSLRGNREADVTANASGPVIAVKFERGAELRAGQVLAKLDARTASLSAAEARAQAAGMGAQARHARAECDTYQKLRETGAVSEFEYQQRSAQCRSLSSSAEAASARAALARQSVSDALIRAPFSGKVAERFVEVGQFVRPDSKIATLVSISLMRLEMAIPEAELPHIREGSHVTFSVASHPGRTFEGTVRFLSSAVRRSTRDLMVEALVENAEGLLLPGMFADVQLQVGSEKLPGVPRSAVVTRGGRAHVFVVASGLLEERIVALGPELGDHVSVREGLTPGETVVVSGIESLSNGQPVQ